MRLITQYPVDLRRLSQVSELNRQSHTHYVVSLNSGHIAQCNIIGTA